MYNMVRKVCSTCKKINSWAWSAKRWLFKNSEFYHNLCKNDHGAIVPFANQGKVLVATTKTIA